MHSPLGYSHTEHFSIEERWTNFDPVKAVMPMKPISLGCSLLTRWSETVQYKSTPEVSPRIFLCTRSRSQPNISSISLLTVLISTSDLSISWSVTFFLFCDFQSFKVNRRNYALYEFQTAFSVFFSFLDVVGKNVWGHLSLSVFH